MIGEKTKIWAVHREECQQCHKAMRGRFVEGIRPKHMIKKCCEVGKPLYKDCIEEIESNHLQYGQKVKYKKNGHLLNAQILEILDDNKYMIMFTDLDNKEYTITIEQNAIQAYDWNVS